MQTIASKLIKKHKIYGKLYSLQKTDHKAGVKHNFVCKWIKEINVIARTEFVNHNSLQRNAIITLTKINSGLNCKLLYSITLT